MKKNYFDPEMEVIELKIASAILVDSDSDGSGDGGVDTTDKTDSSLIGGGEGLG